MPVCDSYLPSPSMPCSACPNSWRKVSSSSNVSSDGAVSVGLVKFITSDTSGRVSLPSSIFVPRNSVIHAPERFDSRGKKSR